jgi:hypothetical protein
VYGLGKIAAWENQEATLHNEMNATTLAALMRLRPFKRDEGKVRDLHVAIKFRPANTLKYQLTTNPIQGINSSNVHIGNMPLLLANAMASYLSKGMRSESNSEFLLRRKIPGLAII